MFQQFGNQLVYAALGIEGVSIYAAENNGGRLGILIINLNPEEQLVPPEWTGAFLGEAQEWLFDPVHHAEQLGAVALDNGATIARPAESMSLFLLTGD